MESVTHESVDESGGHATVEGNEQGEVLLAAQTQRQAQVWDLDLLDVDVILSFTGETVTQLLLQWLEAIRLQKWRKHNILAAKEIINAISTNEYTVVFSLWKCE